MDYCFNQQIIGNTVFFRITNDEEIALKLAPGCGLFRPSVGPRSSTAVSRLLNFFFFVNNGLEKYARVFAPGIFGGLSNIYSNSG